MHIELIKKVSSNVLSSFNNLFVEGAKRELSFEIDCDEFDDYNYIDIRKSENFKFIFDTLSEITGPVLYWFEIVSDTKNELIYQSLIAYRNTEGAKATPALKNTPRIDSRILYVGKVKGSFWGRLITHFGFLKANGTQGLQLFYWTKGINLKLKLHIIEFENDMADYMSILESEFAKKLDPLFGKHN